MDESLFSRILGHMASDSSEYHITDIGGHVIASTDSLRIGTLSQTAEYVIGIGQDALIDHSHNSAESDRITYGSVLKNDENELIGALVIHTKEKDVRPLVVAVKAAIRTALECERFYTLDSKGAEGEKKRICRLLLADDTDTSRLIPLMNRHEIDPHLLRAVIQIRFDFHRMDYFNVNLNLGYQASIEALRKDVFEKLLHSRYITSQDLFYFQDYTTLTVIKSFQPTDDLTRVYMALDAVCSEFASLLNFYTSFYYFIAYGNLYGKISQISKSCQEADAVLRIGLKTGNPNTIFSLDRLLFETVFQDLQPTIINKMLDPAINKLRRKDGSLQTEVIETAEAFVDCSMNFTRTSEVTKIHRNTVTSRIERLRDITGLDPTESFKDAFIIKMLALYLKAHNR